jgi:hypothetical protein
MIKVFGYLKRKPGLSPQEFADYYEHNHVPLVLSKAFMPMVYKRNYIQRGDAFNIEGNEISFDCMTELVFAGPGRPVRLDGQSWRRRNCPRRRELHRSSRNASLRGGRALHRRLSAAPQRIRPEHPCHRSREFQGPTLVLLSTYGGDRGMRQPGPPRPHEAYRPAVAPSIRGCLLRLTPGIPAGDATTTKPASNP